MEIHVKDKRKTFGSVKRQSEDNQLKDIRIREISRVAVTLHHATHYPPLSCCPCPTSRPTPSSETCATAAKGTTPHAQHLHATQRKIERGSEKSKSERGALIGQSGWAGQGGAAKQRAVRFAFVKLFGLFFVRHVL
jgi:hypothetical protein